MSADTFVLITWAPAGRDQGYCSTSCNAQDRPHKKERPGPKREEPRLRNPGLNIWQVCKILVLAGTRGDVSASWMAQLLSPQDTLAHPMLQG